MSGKGWATLIGGSIAIFWLSKMSGREAAAAIVFFLVGAAVSLSIVSLTGGTAANNAKANAEGMKRLSAKERELSVREANLSREVMSRARQIAEQMFAAWKARYEAENSAPQVVYAAEPADYQWSEDEL